MVDAITFLHGNVDLLQPAINLATNSFYLLLRTPAKDAMDQIQIQIAANLASYYAHVSVEEEPDFERTEY